MIENFEILLFIEKIFFLIIKLIFYLKRKKKNHKS